jgi:hypothetical protein
MSRRNNLLYFRDLKVGTLDLERDQTARAASGTCDRAVERCRAEVHVALRHRQVRVSGEFLDRPRWRTSHRQLRAERVTQDVYASSRSLVSLRAASVLHDLPRKW